MEAPTTSARKPHGALASAALIAASAAFVAPISLLYMTACLVLLPSRNLRIRAGNLYGKTIGHFIFAITQIKPAVVHKARIEASAPALFVCNHTSTIDMWVGAWLCPFGGCGVAKKEIVFIPFFGQAYLLSGHLLVDRGNRKRAITSMARAAKLVKKHRLSLWMWPEGTRSDDGRLQPMKKGFVHLAIATRLPVVPVVFHDADLLWSPHRTFGLTSGDLRIEILDPIDTSNWTTETSSEHAQELWNRFDEALGARQRGVSIRE
jgi:1-acyl-sn-glycerol-3-phosphate acyltransferase